MTNNVVEQRKCPELKSSTKFEEEIFYLVILKAIKTSNHV